MLEVSCLLASRAFDSGDVSWLRSHCSTNPRSYSCPGGWGGRGGGRDLINHFTLQPRVVLAPGGWRLTVDGGDWVPHPLLGDRVDEGVGRRIRHPLPKGSSSVCNFCSEPGCTVSSKSPF